MAAAPPARPGQPFELALQLGVGEHLARAAPLASADRQPGGCPRARAVVVPPRRRRRRRRRPTASPDIRTPRRVATSSEPLPRVMRWRSSQPCAFQSSRVRASHAQAPAHRGPPRIQRRRPNPHEPRKSSHRCRSRKQLSHRWSPSVFLYSTDPDSPRLPDSPHRPAPAPGPSQSPQPIISSRGGLSAHVVGG